MSLLFSGICLWSIFHWDTDHKYLETTQLRVKSKVFTLSLEFEYFPPKNKSVKKGSIILYFVNLLNGYFNTRQVVFYMCSCIHLFEIKKIWPHTYLEDEQFSCFLWDRVSLCSPGWPWTHNLPALASKGWHYRHVPPCSVPFVYFIPKINLLLMNDFASCINYLESIGSLIWTDLPKLMYFTIHYHRITRITTNFITKNQVLRCLYSHFLHGKQEIFPLSSTYFSPSFILFY
jgi:hypothetical protein